MFLSDDEEISVLTLSKEKVRLYFKQIQELKFLIPLEMY